MKTTLELPDDLMREIKIRAAKEDRKLKDLIADLLKRGLRDEPGQLDRRRRVKVPLVETAGRDLANVMTPERVAAILLEQEVDWHSR